MAGPGFCDSGSDISARIHRGAVWRNSIDIFRQWPSVSSSPGFSRFFALSAEDTVHLTFSKKIDGGERHSLYRVQRGDWLTRIIRKELNPRENDMAALIEKIQVLNPHIRDMNVIYPGQLLRLPAANGPMEKMSVRGQSPLPEEKAISHGERTLSHRVERGETVTRIMRRRWGMNIHQARMHLEKIRSLNPHIKDLNRIYPGQIIYFPAPNERRRENGTDVDEAASKAAISGRMQAVKVPQSRMDAPAQAIFQSYRWRSGMFRRILSSFAAVKSDDRRLRHCPRGRIEKTARGSSSIFTAAFHCR